MRSVQVDIEDLCNLCEPLQLEEVEEAAHDIMIEQDPSLNPATKGRKRAGTSSTLVSRPAKASKPAQAAQRSLRDFASFASLPAAKTEPSASKVAVDEAAQIVSLIAAHTAEKELRETFMNSAPVKEVIKGAMKQ